MERARTLGELKSRRLQKRLRQRRAAREPDPQTQSGEKLFPGIVGYDETVVPQLVNAILAQHNIFCSVCAARPRAASSANSLTCWMNKFPSSPALKSTTIRLIRYQPMADRCLSFMVTQTQIDWIGRDARFVEKLATPDVTIADIIGDVDPIKAAKGGHLLSDELTIHYGLLPRANRGIFAINELPDLAGKIQVGLFNIMQEGDVQIKGYPVRLPLDVMLVFSANPEDYTARGKIITPLRTASARRS